MGFFGSFIPLEMVWLFLTATDKISDSLFDDQDPPSTAITGVSAVLEDSKGNLWFGTQRAGLLQFDCAQNRFIRYRNNPTDPDSIARDAVNALFEDREGGIWASVVDLGVTRFETTPPSFQKLPRSLGEPHAFGEPFISAIYQDRKGTLWIGTRGQPLIGMDLQTGEPHNLPIRE